MHHDIENVGYVPFSFTDKTYLLVLDDILLGECRDGVTGREVTPPSNHGEPVGKFLCLFCFAVSRPQRFIFICFAWGIVKEKEIFDLTGYRPVSQKNSAHNNQK